MRIRPAPALAVAALALGALVASALGAPLASPALAADPAPDFAFFKENVEPVLQRVCAQCHAGKGKGGLGLIVHAEGVPFPDAEHRTNFDTVRKLVVAGKPDQSKFLLKPLAERDGGVKHGGGDRIFKGTAAHRAWTDFIAGTKGAATPSKPATTASDAKGPDFAYYVARIAPTLQGVCSQCHAGQGKGQFAILNHLPDTTFPIADHRANYEGVLRLLVAGKPEQSRFLLKPLAEADGGVKHGGGDRIRKGDANHVAWTEFIAGVEGPPLPDETPESKTPTVSDKPLVLAAGTLALAGDAHLAKGSDGAESVVAGTGGGRATARFRVNRTGEYAVSLRLSPASRGARLSIDRGEGMDVAPPDGAIAECAPVVVLDGGHALEGRRGSLRLAEGGAVAVDGREGMARFLWPADLAHDRVEVALSVPPEGDPGRDDAWLLFDAIDAENGKFFGFSDAGRKVVMGVVEGGRPRVIASAPRPEGTPGTSLRVDLLPGVAVGRVDGKPLLFVNFDRALGAARFGFQTHALVTVRSLVVGLRGEEVHRMRATEGSVFPLRRGEHTIEVTLPPGGPVLHAVTLKEVDA